MTRAMVIVVTGASGGLGKACATYLSSRGHRVYGTSRRAPPEGIESEVGPGGFRLVKMDITDTASVDATIKEIIEREGRIDALVNNAGLHVVGPAEILAMDDFEASLETNCLGAIRVSRAVLPSMRSAGSGRIVNISSVGGLLGLPFQSAYSAGKFALEGFSESFRAEVRPFGISVCLVEPGDIRHQDCRKETRNGGPYEETFVRVMAKAWKDEERGYPAEKIGPLVERILRCRNPRARYGFGQFFQKTVPILKRFLPSRLVESALRMYYGS
ncbi:MAG TPA: SDR family oxidoreductase [Rectinemataceae bacterium]